MPRSFIAVNGEHVRFNPGGTQGLGASGITFAAIIRCTSNATTQSIIDLTTTGTTGAAGMRLANGSRRIAYYNGSTSSSNSSVTAPLNEWALVATSKAAGTVTARARVFTYSTGLWARADSASTLADTGTVTSTGRVYVGGRIASVGYDGDIAVAGVFPAVLTDAQIEQLAWSLTTWRSFSPAGLWVLDQRTVSQLVGDDTGGGATQAAVVGSAVSTDQAPNVTYGHPVLISTREDGAPPPSTGVVSAALPALTASAAGTASTTAAASATLPSLTGQAVGAASVAGTAQATLPKLGGQATATVTVAATMAATLPVFTATAAGAASVVAGISGALPAVQGSSTGTANTGGTAVATMPKLGAQGAGTASMPVTATGTLPALQLNATGTVSSAATVAATLPSLRSSATGAAASTGAITGSLPALTVTATAQAVIARRPGRFTAGTSRSRLTAGVARRPTYTTGVADGD